MEFLIQFLNVLLFFYLEYRIVSLVKRLKKLEDKINAKKLAIELGIPTVPGSDGAVETVEEAKTISKNFGYPILIKATAGGGGRGGGCCKQSLASSGHSTQHNLVVVVERSSHSATQAELHTKSQQMAMVVALANVAVLSTGLDTMTHL
jgi:carbamoylphosphate synthase large subunit